MVNTPNDTEPTDTASDSVQRLLTVMARLRDPVTGCSWDLAQDFASIAPYTIEEAYEVADAIERTAYADLREELGDLLLQVVFHARIAEEAGLFTFTDVANSISDKMVARHPHIFGNAGGTMGETRWEKLKAAERQQKGEASAMDGVATTLPAALRAQKLQKRAARDGFDWPDTAGPAAKVIEEMEELKTADAGHKVEEAGDLMFAAVNLVRAHGIAAEDALRAANRKFERRYRSMETLANNTDASFANLTLDEKESLWQAVKRGEKS
ncbi:nucleoside triphosphate pyrophosphohydrolase [Alteripontixanthobacter maritimus]|nr:nucleoside triphosphate pyrophosphohydrolase [Alteripontixanthobacter maritimus]